MKIQYYPYFFPINKGRLAFIRTHCIALYAVTTGRSFCPFLGKQQHGGEIRSRVTSFNMHSVRISFSISYVPGIGLGLEMERRNTQNLSLSSLRI